MTSKSHEAGATIERLILSIRDQRVILAGDLAMVYGVETRRLNEQVRRNSARFPRDFVFQLSREEFAVLRSQKLLSPDGRVALRSQIAILKRQTPWVTWGQGHMGSDPLKSGSHGVRPPEKGSQITQLA